ncbi:MAG: Mu-like prophage major head subunit gpT family protein, partial [Nitrospinae bacterium]|nr:Mu-like prophage major head subunit gpT family protein [Nitrospinota bacterium]
YTSFKVIFQQAYDGAATSLRDLAVSVPSTTRQEEYRWLGQFPGLREWIGDRVVKDLSVDGFVIKNRDFEATVSVDRNDLEDDAIGIYSPLIQQLGETAKQHPDQLLYELLVSGFTANGFDGTSFFSASHPNGRQSAYSNRGTAALDVAAYEAARAGMMSMVNEEGRPLRLLPSHLIVPPQLEATARAILRADKTANGSTNIWFESADVLVASELAAHPTYWFLADLKHAAKPLIFQTRKMPEFMALDKLSDENVFFRKEYVYGVDYRGNAGFGLPHLIHGSTGGA